MGNLTTFHYINIKKPYQKSKSCKSQILSKDHTSSSKDHTSKSIKEVHKNANLISLSCDHTRTQQYTRH